MVSTEEGGGGDRIKDVDGVQRGSKVRVRGEVLIEPLFYEGQCEVNGRKGRKIYCMGGYELVP